MPFHIDPAATERDPLGLQPETLLERRIAAQFDFSSGAENALPRQAMAAPTEDGGYAPRRMRVSRGPAYSAVSRHLAARNASNRSQDSFPH